jgi:hypothetical protein
MGWRILVNFIPRAMLKLEHELADISKFYPSSQRRGIKFTNIRQPMLKLKTHSGFHDLSNNSHCKL